MTKIINRTHRELDGFDYEKKRKKKNKNEVTCLFSIIHVRKTKKYCSLKKSLLPLGGIYLNVIF